MLPYAHSGPPPHLSEATAHATNNTCTSKLPAHDQLLAEKEVSVSSPQSMKPLFIPTFYR
jgi:hypothetical protein